jgi:hypothetical protein
MERFKIPDGVRIHFTRVLYNGVNSSNPTAHTMSSAYYLDVPSALILLALWLAARLFTHVLHRPYTTKLNGPSKTSWIYGLSRDIAQAPDANALYEGWATRYGSVYEIPKPFGRKEIVLTDPKALLHFYQSDRAVYVKTENNRRFFEKVVGCLGASLPTSGANTIPGSLDAGFCGLKAMYISGQACRVALQLPAHWNLINVTDIERPLHQDLAARRSGNSLMCFMIRHTRFLLVFLVRITLTLILSSNLVGMRRLNRRWDARLSRSRTGGSMRRIL